MKKCACLFLAVSLLIGMCLSGCSPVYATDLMADIKANPVSDVADLSSHTGEVTDFCIRLFQFSMEEGKNTLISPLSVLYALSMTANGADGQTLAQMEDVLGMDIDSLNSWLYTYLKQLSSGKKYTLSLANSVWFKDDPNLTVEASFLQTNADYYDADIYKAAFDDTTLRDINNWVKSNTDGMIDRILNEIPQDAVLYMINALAFEAQWKEVYEKSQIRDGTFTAENGGESPVELMYSEEYQYLCDELATGFVKYYADSKYAFVALLPNEGVSISEYVSGLTGTHLQQLLDNCSGKSVTAAIPKFETSYFTEISEVLKNMGITDAFSGTLADFSSMAHSERGNIYINRVLHKTYLSVDATGTKAAAVTAVEMTDEAAVEVQQSVEVILDRPFVYMLIDVENGLPFFIGTLMDPGQ